MRAPEGAAPAMPRSAPTRARRLAAAARRGAAALAAHERRALAALVLVHWVAVAAFALTVRHNGWAYYQGGDQIWLATTGWLLAGGELAPTYVGYGWPLVLAPMTALTGPGYLAAMPLVVAVNVLVLAPLALWAVHGLAARVAGPLFGLLAAATWVAAPFAVIPLWRADYHERYVEQFLPQAVGLTALADYPSLVLLVVAAHLFVRALGTRAPLDAVAAGLVAGFAIGTKPSNALFLAAPPLAALAARRVRPLLPYALALVPAALTLALWKQRGLGTLPLLAFEEARTAVGATAALALPDVDRYLNVDLDTFRSNMAHLREYFWSARLLQWLPLAGLVGLARFSPPVAAAAGGWFATFLVFKGATPLSTVESGSFFRLLLPALPAYVLLAVGVVLLVPTLGRRTLAAWPAAPLRVVPTRAVVALAVLLALLPLAAAALARPLAEPPRALLVNGILTPVDDGVRVDVAADGEARTLSWEHDGTGRGAVFYRVYRTAAGGADHVCARDGGAAECSLQLLLLGTTREPRWRDGSPPPGATYRIGIATNWLDDPEAGDVFLLSPPVPAS